MIMNATEIEKGAKEKLSKLVVNNANNVYEKRILKAKESGKKFAKVDKEEVYPETIQYFKSMGYAISDNGGKYKIIWDSLYEKSLKKEIIRRIAFETIALLILISFLISLYVDPTKIGEGNFLYDMKIVFGMPLSLGGSVLILLDLVCLMTSLPTRK